MQKQTINLRQQQEEFENLFLSQKAAKSIKTKGRAIPEEPCVIRTEFQRDRDRIIHSKAFRRLKQKTQVFISPSEDHYRTRLTHTLEVSQIARTIARALKLNEDLTEAISMGHDLGHTPFGHSGEAILNKLFKEGFRHNEQSERVVQHIEKLNLTKETIDGIKNHTGEIIPFTLEGQIVRNADRIAYLNHDIDDSIRAGLISIQELPEDSIHILGNSCSERITVMVCSTVTASNNKNLIQMDPEIQQATDKLRTWMFENVYLNHPEIQEEREKAETIIQYLFEYYKKHPSEISIPSGSEDTERLITDYIAGMTDRYAIKVFSSKFLPTHITI